MRCIERYVYKLLALRRETSDLTMRPQGGGAVTKMNEKRLFKLAEPVAANQIRSPMSR
jgi:hypothetical protein